MAQMGFFDFSDRYASLDAKKDPLAEIDAVVPWKEFRQDTSKSSLSIKLKRAGWDDEFLRQIMNNISVT